MPRTEERALIQEAAKRFAAERLAPFAAQWDREHTFPAEAVAELGTLGFLGMLVPDEWGGGGAGYLAYALAVEEIAAGDGSVSTIMCVQNTLIALPLLRFATEAQKKHLLGPVARGETLGCFCLTEPQAGSDAGNLKTRARRDGDGWVLSGTKQFITSGARADLAVVFAVSEPQGGKERHLRLSGADRQSWLFGRPH